MVRGNSRTLLNILSVNIAPPQIVILILFGCRLLGQKISAVACEFVPPASRGRTERPQSRAAFKSLGSLPVHVLFHQTVSVWDRLCFLCAHKCFYTVHIIYVCYSFSVRASGSVCFGRCFILTCFKSEWVHKTGIQIKIHMCTSIFFSNISHRLWKH